MRYVLLSWILLYSLEALASGPSVRFDRLGVEDGLSQNTIPSMVQDSSGFLWIATLDGLNRFDGYEFKVYRHDPKDPHSLTNSHVWFVHEDNTGVLWVGTRDGLNKYDAQKDHFIRYSHAPKDPHSLIHNNVRAIFDDSTGTVWIGTYGGLSQYDRQNDRFSHFIHQPTDPQSISSNRIRAIFEDANGGLWLGTDGGGLNKYNRTLQRFEHFRHDPSDPSSLSDDRIKAIGEDAQGQLWVGTYKGLNRFDGKSGHFTRFYHQDSDASSLSHNMALSIKRDRKGTLWIGTLGGLNRFDAKRQRFVHWSHQASDPQSLSDDIIWSIYQDRQAVLWVGTVSGLNRYNVGSDRFIHFNHQADSSDSLAHKNVMSIYQTKSGVLWVGTAGGGLNRYDAQSGGFTHFKHQSLIPDSLSDNRVFSMFEDQKGHLWVGTGGGLNKLDQQNQRFSHYKHDKSNPRSLSNDLVSAILEDSQGTLWIGTYGGGLNKYSAATEDFERFTHQPKNPTSLSHNLVRTLYEDSQGTLWVGTLGGGLNRFNRQTQTFERIKHQPSNSQSLSHNSVYGIHEDSKGQLWVGTDGGGLNKYYADSGKFTHYREAQGLVNDTVYGIVEDLAGQLWMSTNKGLSRFNPVSETFRNYDVKDGLQSNEFNGGAFWRGQDGELFFGGINGFNRFFAANIQDDTTAPAVVLTDFLLFNQPVSIQTNQQPNIYTLPKAINALSAITLGYEQSLVSFEFAALHFANPARNQYVYKLEGLDKDWIKTDAKMRRATYTNIPSGDYVFTVRASNKDGYWHEQGKSLRIIVEPPPWETWWAYTIYWLLALMAATFIVLAHRKKIANERAVIVQLMQVDKLKDEFLANTSHELRTPLNGIIGLAESLMDGVAGNLPEKANHNLAMVVTSGRRLADLVNDILDFSKLNNASIELFTRPIDLYAITDVVITLLQPLMEGKQVTLVNNVAKDLPPAQADEDRLQQILHNLLGNAIKFTEKGSITVTARETDSGLEVNVADTGIGISEAQFATIFDSFEQAHSSEDRAFGGTGLGLTVCKQLVELHGGWLSVDSQVGVGSTFSFTLPESDESTAGEISINQAVARLHFLENYDEKGGRIGVASPLLAPPEAPSDGSQFRILLVDDEPVNRQVLHDHLSQQNYQLVEAVGGQQALDIVAQFEALNSPFDLILLDIMMPKLSGYDVCKKLRETYPVSDLAVIFLTAKNQVADLVQSFAVGANDYLTKPVSKHELLTRVKNHLKLLDINRNLESKVAERTADLVRSNQLNIALREVCTEISSTLEPTQLFDIAYYRIVDLMDADIFCIGLYQSDKQQVVFDLAIECNEYLPCVSLQMSEKNRPAVWCIEHNKPVIINDMTLDLPRYFGDLTVIQAKVNQTPKSLVYWPLTVGEHIIGVLTVQSYRANAYDENRQNMIQALSSTMAIALDNAAAYREVAQKNREIVDTQQKMVESEKMASVGTLTAGVAHEINNPTNFVHVSAQNLEVDLTRFEQFLFDLAGKDADPAILTRFRQKFAPLYSHLTTIQEGTHRIKTIVQDLRAFTQLDVIDKKTVSVLQCLQSTINLVRTQNLEITEFVSDFKPTPLIACYPAQLNQVFMNLIVNACDAIRDKKRLTPVEGCVYIGCQKVDNAVVVTIKDNGCGMSDETKHKLFEPFYTTKGVGEGTGLGLSISYGIVQKHQGQLVVESLLGEGTTFTLTLPYGERSKD